ncbi:hypothetical protein LC593_34965 [Nostoc sp. CHAB 5844]|nr:hypothetical protein [Nostoc sp. CHAB 5844]
MLHPSWAFRHSRPGLDGSTRIGGAARKSSAGADGTFGSGFWSAVNLGITLPSAMA